MTTLDAQPFLLTFRLALISTCILFVIALPLACWLAYSQKRFKIIIEAIVALPVVLPPSVLGFYLLILLSPEKNLGGWLARNFDLHLVFTFPGLVVASVIYSLPFMVQPIQAGFQQLPGSLREASYTLGKSTVTTLFRVLLPNMKIALLTGCVLTFAHTVGEFGVVLMVGGNIPGETRVLSLAIYDEVESMNYDNANRYSLILLAFTFVVLITVYFFNYRHRRKTEVR